MEQLHPEGVGDGVIRPHRAFWHSVLLAILFGLAMLLTVLLMDVVVGLLLGLFVPQGSVLWHAGTSWVIGVMLALLLTGTGLEWYRLREGGQAIARRLGARCLGASATVYEERQLLRVVEQLALASGLPAPVAYVLDDEPAINALVAGDQASDMVLVVTWGALQTLDFDELRGVVGHEFSHIDHGDTRLNLRLMSVLGGLLLISQMGRWLLQFGQPTRQRGGHRSAWLWSFLGRVVWLIGSLGVFMGRFIKLAMLRQREFMADAASVQLTHSDAVLRALLRIRAHDSGSMLYGMHAESISHLCFGSALMSDGWFSTHPALDDRIGRLSEETLQRVQARDRVAVRHLRTPTPVGSYPAPLAKQDQTLEWQPPSPLPHLRVMTTTGTRAALLEPLALAQRLPQPHPDTIRRALSTGAGCRELLAAFMANRQQVHSPPEDRAVSRALIHALQAVESPTHLLLFHAALAGLGDLPESAARQLLRRLALMIQSDGQVALADVLLLEWLKAKVSLLPDSLPIAFADCHYDLQVLVDALLQMQQLPLAQQTPIRIRVLQTLFQVIDEPPPMLTGPVDLGALLTRLAGLPHLHRVSIVAVIETCLWADLPMSQDEHDVLALLRWRLGLTSEVLAGLETFMAGV